MMMLLQLGGIIEINILRAVGSLNLSQKIVANYLFRIFMFDISTIGILLLI